MKKLTLCLLVLNLLSSFSYAQPVKHTFAFSNTDFLLDGKPYQIISGEMHPARIPAEYWRHRIQMAKAMGCNTIAAYVFWNYHELSEGVYDFTTWNRDLTKFINIAQEEGMWVLLRPGPYVCAEWDFGGIPTYLLKIPDIKVRCMDPRYMKAVESYLSKLAEVIKPLQVDKGGPILMVQIENEYGSYGNDREYLKTLADLWRKNGITIPFFTGDGPTQHMLEAGSLKGCASGLDSGSEQKDFDLATSMNPGVPVFSSETYPGWLTHWGEKWAKPDSVALLKEVKFLMDTKKSFNLYVIHGGTNFGFTAGANSGGKGYEPDVTSYDYDAPIDEQGLPTTKYFALRKLIRSYLPSGSKLPEIPKPIAAIEIQEIQMKAFASIWDNLPTAILSVQPKSFEALDQNQGFMLYRTTLIGHKSGKLDVTELHDYANIFVNGNFIGKLDRREDLSTIRIPKTDVKDPILDILVEGMGHINFAQHIIDRKGITERVTLNGMTLMNWEIFKLPMNDDFISSLKSSTNLSKPGIFFKSTFNLNDAADTYFDMSNYSKGVVWVNGHNLGRYWEIGPQKRLYCPASWLKKGDNEIVVFDLHLTEAKTIKGYKTIE
ncbi:MAG: beta-galactosidase [Bacteroidales bacterium]|nr:MAG: beta-galactosidase [Bacteroidales bacterium]